MKSLQKAECSDFEVICGCGTGCQPSPLIQNNELHVAVHSSTTGNDTLKTYNLINCQEHTQEIKKSVSYGTCKMFYSKKISLLMMSGKSDNTTKLGLYQLNTKTLPASWDLILRSSVPLLGDFKNLIPISHMYKDDGVIVVSVVNQQANTQILFHIFSQSKAEKLKSASLHIHTTKCQIQSCAVMLNHIYCSLLSPEGGACIYKFDIAALQRYQKETQKDKTIYNCNWSIRRNTSLQNCFMSVLAGKVYIIVIFTNLNNKSVVEIRWLIDPSEVSSIDYQFEFPCVVRVVAAAVIPGVQRPLMVVMYHDNKTNKCFIKRAVLS